MKFITGRISYQDGVLSVDVPKGKATQIGKLLDAVQNGKPLDVEFSIHYDARTIRQNNTFWGMLGAEAKVLRTTSWELYLKALEDYGVSRYSIIDPDDLEKEERCHRLVRVRRHQYVNGYKFLVIEIWDGSSNFNRAEMSRFIDGIIYDCKELGIEYISNDDKELILNDYFKGQTNGS